MISNLQDVSHNPHTKHFCIEGHWVWELIDHSEVKITYVQSTENTVDVLMKVLNTDFWFTS